MQALLAALMNDGMLQVNFNFSFPHLKCEYASVDATNFMGTHDAGLAARVSKVRLDKEGKQVGRLDDSKKKELRHTTDETPHEGTQFTCFTCTTVQILTLKALMQARRHQWH